MRFGSYLIHEELGTGGMASVHLAEMLDGGHRKRVALKRLYPHVAEIPELAAMFIDEARLARYLRHPNIAQVYEFGRITGVYFIAFEFVPGPTVHQLARQCAAHVGPIPVPIVLEIAMQLCEALDHAHNLRDEAGQPLSLVHRDVSPQNLIVANTGLVKLIDFGLAKAKHSSVQSQAGIIKGKHNYIAPEYLAGKLDRRCDIWAVGVVMHELLTGRRLFAGPDDFTTLQNVRTMAIPPPSRANAEVSTKLDEIVLGALERDPNRRWQTAAELRTAIAGHANQRQQVSKRQLVSWVEWAFSQKVKLQEESGLLALSDIMSNPAKEIPLVEDAAAAAAKLPAISAAMMERRRESVAMLPVGEAMLRRRGRARAWVWMVVLALLAAAATAFIVHAKTG